MWAGHEVNIVITGVLKDVRDEISRAVDKHGIDRTPLNPGIPSAEAFLCIAEEFGELEHELTYDADGTPEERVLNAEKEAIQTAAMAIAFVVGSRRRGLLK